ncbi:MAG: hypothetical protein U1F68_13245 [Gammaproteobacteria bacterium]
MNHYVLIDHDTGSIAWSGEAADPTDAAQRADQALHDMLYVTEHDYTESSGQGWTYEVYECSADFDVHDGQDPIHKVKALPVAAHIYRVERDASD